MLNSNVALDLKQVSGVPYWKARGADTWNPFNSDSGNFELIYQSSIQIKGYNAINTISNLSKKPQILIIDYVYDPSSIWVCSTIITSVGLSSNTYIDGNTYMTNYHDFPIKLQSYDNNSISFTLAWGINTHTAKCYIYG